MAGCPRLAGCASARRSGGVSSARPGPRGQCNCNMISTWKKYFPAWQIILQHSTQSQIYSTQNDIYIATHTAVLLLIPLLIPLLILRERVNPCALMIGA